MASRTDKIERKVRIKGAEVIMDLTARDICSKEEFIQLYDQRVQQKMMLQQNIEQGSKQLEAIGELESNKNLMKVAATIEKYKEKDPAFFENLFKFIQKEYTINQIKNMEKSLKMLELEFEDLNKTYTILKKELGGENAKPN